MHVVIYWVLDITMVFGKGVKVIMEVDGEMKKTVQDCVVVIKVRN